MAKLLKDPRKLIILVIVLAVLYSLPLSISPYLVTVFFFLFTYVILAESYDIFSGYTGYYNLGHGAFFALGGYTYAILETGRMLPSSVPIFVSFPAAMIVPALFAFLISYPFFRLRGAYFAVASFGLIPLLFYLANNLRPITGGREGIHIALPEAGTAIPAYYIGLTVALIAVLTNYLVAKGKFGLALISIREDEDVATEYGINNFRVKMKALVLSAAFAGLAGATFVYQLGVACPDGILGMELALAPVVMTIFGGLGSYVGALLGAVVLVAIQEVLWTQMTYFHLFTYGILLLIVGIIAPGGIVRVGPLKRIFRPPE